MFRARAIIHQAYRRIARDAFVIAHDAAQDLSWAGGYRPISPLHSPDDACSGWQRYRNRSHGQGAVAAFWEAVSCRAVSSSNLSLTEVLTIQEGKSDMPRVKLLRIGLLRAYSAKDLQKSLQ